MAFENCATQLISTLDEFADYLKMKEQVGAILMKLGHLGIRDSLLSWCKSFLVDGGMALDPCFYLLVKIINFHVIDLKF